MDMDPEVRHFCVDIDHFESPVYGLGVRPQVIYRITVYFRVKRPCPFWGTTMDENVLLLAL